MQYHKFDHYFPIYERHLGKFRGTQPTLLEIGVESGGSLRYWKQLLDCKAVVGLDINHLRAQCSDEANGIHIVIGHQADRFALDRCNARGPFGVIVDDGSHDAKDQLATFDYLWPMLNAGGVYIIEDCIDRSFWELFSPHVKAMHLCTRITGTESDFHTKGFNSVCAGIHIYPLLVVLEKNAQPVERLTAQRREIQ